MWTDSDPAYPLTKFGPHAFGDFVYRTASIDDHPSFWVLGGQFQKALLNGAMKAERLSVQPILLLHPGEADFRLDIEQESAVRHEAFRRKKVGGFYEVWLQPPGQGL